ncbi:hypothetical protein AKJ56_01290 [candidate division MSBL1 archaeon SCGC-AAA382N08]|uniref:50S ribosomal protein L32 n=1 Tax=candidate division MSBL1 archaeon SCGC-AAA382N08 TaxID=1698285 RepID=A0A133VPT5_9EURY|nr:hypothetical protein AKJ56_01290 [candidate division MSBL1 archaeon SCGC-AAA382N08]
MPVPKKRKTKSQQGKRRAHIKVEEKELTECSQCGAAVRPHTVCSNCGYYRGEQVVKQEPAEGEAEPAEEEEEQKEGLSWEGLSRS